MQLTKSYLKSEKIIKKKKHEADLIGLEKKGFWKNQI